MRCIHAKKSARHSLHSLCTPLVHILECTPCMSCQICPLPSIQIWVPGITSGSSSTVWRVREQRSMALRWRKGSSTGAKKEPEHLNAAAYQPPPLATRESLPRPLPPGNCVGQIRRWQLESPSPDPSLPAIAWVRSVVGSSPDPSLPAIAWVRSVVGPSPDPPLPAIAWVRSVFGSSRAPPQTPKNAKFS